MLRPLNWTVGFLSGLTTLAGWAGIGPDLVRQYLPLFFLIAAVVAASELFVFANHRRQPADANAHSGAKEQITTSRTELHFGGFRFIQEQTVTIRTLSLLLVFVIAGLAIYSRLSFSNRTSSTAVPPPLATVSAPVFTSPEPKTPLPLEDATPTPQEPTPPPDESPRQQPATPSA